MAWNGSGVYGQTLIVDPLSATQSGLDLTAETHRAALYTNDRPDPDYSAAAPVYATTGEVEGTGYVAGGIVITGTTLTQGGGSASWDADDLSWPDSTLSAVRGCDLYAPDLSNALIAGIDFGTEYSTSDGELLLSVNPAGLIVATYA